MQGRGRTDLLGGLAAVVIGIAVFLVWAGPQLLDPANIGWLQKSNGDPQTDIIGWWFFRSSPWGIPPGFIPRNGIEYVSSIGLSSLPLMALPLKLLQSLLPPIGQYLGPWLLICLMMQAVFGYLLIRELRGSVAVALLGAAILCFSPPMLFQAIDHMPLAGHGLVLAGLWLYVKRTPPPWWAWPLLLGIATLAAIFLMAMVFAIWAAAVVQRFWLHRKAVPLAIEAVLVVAIVYGLMWTVGLLVVGSFDAWGLGIFRFNLLSLIDPNSWSAIMPDIPNGFGDYEGFAYLGLGMIFLLILGLVSGALRPVLGAPAARWFPLILALLGLTIAAISPVVAIGPLEVLSIPLPPFVERIWSMFRSSGRLFWPVYYMLVVTILVVVERKFGARAGAVLVAAALLINVAETYPGWRSFGAARQEYATTWSTPLVSPFWEAASTRYARLREIPRYDIGRYWIYLASFAATHGMASDSTYVGRIDNNVWQRERDRAEEAAVTGSFEADSVYVVSEAYARWVARQATRDDFFGRLDGLIVFARFGADLAPGSGLTPYDATAPAMLPGARFDLSQNRDGWEYLTGEWRGPWFGGAMAVEQRAGIQFQSPGLGQGAVLRLALRVNTTAPGVPQVVRYSVNGGPEGELMIPDAASAPLDIPLVPHPDGNYLVHLEIAEAEGPFIPHPARDFAPVGLVVTTMELVPATGK